MNLEELSLVGSGVTSEVFTCMGPEGPAVLKVFRDPHAQPRREVDALFRARGPALPGLTAVLRVELDGRSARPSADGRPALLLEGRSGQSLASVTATIDPVRVASDLARGLAALHRAGLAHGDVKPENVVVDERGAFLIDLGLAVPVDTRTPEGATPRYLPPTPRGLGTAESRDLFALGLLLAELLDGSLRAELEPARLATERAFDGRLGEVVGALLLEDPRARPNAAWIARFLALPGADAEADRIATVRSAYLSLRPVVARPHVAHEGAPTWLVEACELSRGLAALGGLGARDVTHPLGTHEKRALLALLFGELATRVDGELLASLDDPELLARLVGLATTAPLESVTLAGLTSAMRGDGRATAPADQASDTRGSRDAPSSSAALPGPTPERRGIAATALALAETPPAAWAIDRVERDDPDDADLVLAGARALRLSGEIGRAFLVLRRALARRPEDAELAAGAAELARRMGAPKTCEALLARVDALSIAEDTRRRANATRARLAFDSGDPDLALRLLASARAPFELEVLGLARAARGETTEARALLHEAAVLPADNEQRARVWGALGYVAAGVDPAEALGAFEKAVEYAASASALVEEATYATGLGGAALSLGRVATAVSASERAWLLWEALRQPDRATRALLNLGATHRVIGQLEIARSYATRARERALRSGDKLARLYADVVLTDAGETDALERLAAELSPALSPADQLTVGARLEEHGSLAAEETRRLDELASRGTLPSGPRADWLAARLGREDLAAETARRFARALADTAADCPAFTLGPALLVAGRVADAHGHTDVASRTRRRLADLADHVRRYGEGFGPHLAKLPWMLTRSAANVDPEKAPEQVFRLEQLVRSLSNESRLRDLLRSVVDALVAWTGAERGVLLLPAPDGRLVPRAARNLDAADLSEEQLGVSMSLARRAIETRAPVLATDAVSEIPNLSASVHALHLRSVLTVPLVASGEVVGVVYLDDRLREGTFGRAELEWARTVATLAAAMVARATQTAKLRRAMRKEAFLRRSVEEQLTRSLAELASLERSQDDRSKDDPFKALIGTSSALRTTLAIAERAARADVHVLLLGESGTGKELLARAIHKASPRRAEPFVSENVAAIPETLLESTLFGHVRGAFTGADRTRIGLFEAADGGTLFLDEVGEMSLPMQTKLLRVLEDGVVRPVGTEKTRRVSVRILAATHRDLEELVAKKLFREDLFYRLSVLPIRLPPLRERRSDVAELVRHFLERHATTPGARITEQALTYLENHPLPGNVRQLENLVRRALILSPERIELAHVASAAPGLPTAPTTGSTIEGRSLRDQLDDLERVLVRAALESTQGNQTQAAKRLGVSRFGLAKMLKRLGLGDGSPKH
jgi:transcriptional regulator with GAF, ATPase, and Fis domain